PETTPGRQGSLGNQIIEALNTLFGYLQPNGAQANPLVNNAGVSFDSDSLATLKKVQDYAATLTPEKKEELAAHVRDFLANAKELTHSDRVALLKLVGLADTQPYA